MECEQDRSTVHRSSKPIGSPGLQRLAIDRGRNLTIFGWSMIRKRTPETALRARCPDGIMSAMAI
jgi:hypothetical protein